MAEIAEPSTRDDIKQLKRSELYLIATLCYVNTINYMDRIGLASVLVKIQEYFNIDDAYGGLLQTSLLTAYTFSAPFFGYCGDRFSRKWLIIPCMLIWALATVGGALTKYFWIFLVSRMLVGVGQSGFTAITPTIISDVTVRGARTVVLSIFYLGIPMGGGLGYIVTVSVMELTGSWKYGLCVGPVLCLIGAGLLSFAKFPERGEKDFLNLDRTVGKATTSYGKDLRYLMSISSFITLSAAFACICFCAGAISWWMPKCLYFGFQLIPGDSTDDLQSSSLYFGVVMVTTGILGVLFGLILSRLFRPRFPNCDPIICGLGLIFASPFIAAALALMAKSRLLTFVCLFLSIIQVDLNWALITDMLLSIVVPFRRTSALGVHMLITHLFGDCISPYIVGFISDTLRYNLQFTNGSFFLPYKNVKPINPNSNAQEFHSMQWSLFCIIFIILLGALFFLVTARFIEKDIDEAKK